MELSCFSPNGKNFNNFTWCSNWPFKNNVISLEKSLTKHPAHKSYTLFLLYTRKNHCNTHPKSVATTIQSIVTTIPVLEWVATTKSILKWRNIKLHGSYMYVKYICWIFFDLLQTPIFSLKIFFFNHNKHAQNNKSTKYHFT